MVKWKLFLDDTRNPSSLGWNIARSIEHAKIMISMWGLPFEMSLDHDLGETETGYDFVKWLIERHLDLRDVNIIVHSSNPVGKKNIESLIKWWNEKGIYHAK